uniref:Uncharacterized protein n=1 Tax=Myoviridae sp. ctLnO19 TaxID=2825085 RepID=A0A8S5P1Q3_9CAUD|nr:MAG TPA: hypothetical protein [Myoviridae sp. ctLnO19]DAJ69098.1 MAG TPA: hypothetical protein [Caudoviricetes sp.]
MYFACSWVHCFTFLIKIALQSYRLQSCSV